MNQLEIISPESEKKAVYQERGKPRPDRVNRHGERVDNGGRIIALTKGLITIVDEEDFDFLNRHSWHAHSCGYAARKYKQTGKNISVYMHREILKAPVGILVDHIDQDVRNNRKSNLRLCTKSENARNTKIDSRNKTGFRGVFWESIRKKYGATISCRKKMFYLGYFNDPVEAARVRDLKAKELFGEFAKLNFP